MNGTRKHKVIFLVALVCLWFSIGIANSETPQIESTVKVAVIHFAPELGKVEDNVRELLSLTQEAAENGAKIIVHTEMATSGYAYFSRSDIARVAETIPGPTTGKFGNIAEKYHNYIVLGMPELEPETNLYYNAAVLIGPDGNVVGKYRKRNNLLEASYNAEVFGPAPTFPTPYGRLGIVICADLLYPHFSRLAAISGADIILAPANVGITADFLQVRAFENDCSLVVANRFGSETKGAPLHVFNEETFSIPSPFAYDFNTNCLSAVVTNSGRVLLDISEHSNTIGYAELPIVTSKTFPVTRRPHLYALIAQDTLESYTQKQLGLPPASNFTAAAIDPGPSDDPWKSIMTSLGNAVSLTSGTSQKLRLAVLPGNYLKTPEEDQIRHIQEFAKANGIDVVIGFGETSPPSSQLITSSGEIYTYGRTHKSREELFPEDLLANDFFIIDRNYARLAVLHDKDLFAPETGIVMAKMGVDVIAVNADSPESVLTALWQSRTSDYVHIVVANRRAKEGIYLGGYRAVPSYREADGMVIMDINTSDVRDKKEPRFLDPTILLKENR